MIVLWIYLALSAAYGLGWITCALMGRAEPER